MMKYIYLITLLFAFSCTSLRSQEERGTGDEFKITSINKTKNHYIYNVVDIKSKDEGKILIKKKSNQLKDKHIEVGKKYSFLTEELKVALGGHIVYEVDGKEVWDAFEDGFLRIAE